MAPTTRGIESNKFNPRRKLGCSLDTLGVKFLAVCTKLASPYGEFDGLHIVSIKYRYAYQILEGKGVYAGT